MKITDNIIQDIVEWIKEFFDKNSDNGNAVIGISGGKDSTVVAALCVKALGKDRVIGVLMPNNIQDDIEDSFFVVNYLGIKSLVINIGNTYNSLINEVTENLSSMEGFPTCVSSQTKINLPARLRMSTLYAVSQSCNGRVANTCNLSEDYIGYSTRYGDSVGDFSPLSNFTVNEVIQIGKILGIPNSLIEKKPSDGLCGKNDEDKIGFTYETLDRYIRTGICDDMKIKAKIDLLHKTNEFKLKQMPSFNIQQ